MVRTTLNIDDDLYRKLVEESIRKYGTTRKLSKIVCEKLRLAEKIEFKSKEKSLPEIELGRRIDWKFVEEVVKKEAENLWKL